MRSSLLLLLAIATVLAAPASAQSSFFGKKTPAAANSAPVPTVTVTKPGTAAPDSDVRTLARTTQQPAPGGGNAVFRVGDSLDMRVSGVPAEDSAAFPTPVTIGADGFINITYVGQIRAAGLAQSELEGAIRKRFIDEKIFRWPTVTINVLNQQRTVTIGGNVRAPGRQPWSADLTLLSAIASAGGPSDFAGDKVNLIRNGTVTLYRYKLLKKNPGDDPKLSPGDQVDFL